MSISTLPPAPSKTSDSVTEFALKADALVAALGTFVTEANALASDVNTAETNSEAAVTAAEEAAEAAEAAAQVAVNAPGTSGTSVTSMTVGTGTKTFTTQASKLFVVGMSVKIASTADGTIWMAGDVTAYNSGTGSMTVEVAVVQGSGTIDDWIISLSGVSCLFWVEWATTAADLTAVAAHGYFVDSSAAARIITLPLTPQVNTVVGIGDLAGTFQTNTCTIARNGEKIMGVADDLVLDVKNQVVVMVYTGATYGWKIVHAMPVGGVTRAFDTLHVRHQESSGTAGGASVAGTNNVRKITTTVGSNEIVGASVDSVSNQVTLPAGTYDIKISAATYGGVGLNKLRLFNYSDSTYDLEGLGCSTSNSPAELQGSLVLASSKTFEIRHFTQSAVATNGLGAAVSQGAEVYMDAIFRRRNS